MACALVSARGRILLARRPPGGLLGGLRGLPAAEVDGAARPREALARSLRASLGLRVAVGGVAGSARRVLTHRDLELVAYRCALRGAPPEGLRWARPADLGSLGVATAMRALLAAARDPR
jgi:adenine-specific DNA glycosylase